MVAIGANPLFIVGGVSVLKAVVASLIVQFVILKQSRKLGGAVYRILSGRNYAKSQNG